MKEGGDFAEGLMCLSHTALSGPADCPILECLWGLGCGKEKTQQMGGSCGFSGHWQESAGLWGASEGPTWGTRSAQRRHSRCGAGSPRAGEWLSGDSAHPAVTEALRAPGKIPGCSGTRNLHDNLSDLRAQVAANQKGIQLVGELIGQYGLDVVQAYMGHIQVGLGQEQWGGPVPAPRQLGR